MMKSLFTVHSLILPYYVSIYAAGMLRKTRGKLPALHALPRLGSWYIKVISLLHKLHKILRVLDKPFLHDTAKSYPSNPQLRYHHRLPSWNRQEGHL